MIRFACPGCNATFTAPDDRAGKTSNCPKCKAPFLIPGEAPPPAAIVLDAELDDDDDAPRRRPRREDDDDRPRRRSRRDDDDDRPRSRSRRDDDDDDRPRRRRDRDDDDEDYEPRRKPKKKKTTSGMILACGIISLIAALAIGGLAIYDISDLSRVSFAAPRGMRDLMPPEVRSALGQIENAFICFQAAVYLSLVAAVLYLATGIGLVLHQIFGKYTSFGAVGLSLLAMLAYLIFMVLLTTVSVPGRGSTPDVPVLRTLFRMVLHIVPLVFIAITLFNATHTRFLRYKL